MSSSPPIPLTAYLGLIELTFERGAYDRALQWVDEALIHYPLAGILKLWQGLALEAMGRSGEAIALVRPLLRHGDADVVERARYLLSVWEAPRLQRPREWLTEIPDLSHLSEDGWNLTPVLPRRSASRSQADALKSQSSHSPEQTSSIRGRALWIGAALVGLLILIWGVIEGLQA